LVLAVPVAPAEALEELRRDVDDVVCLSAPMFFTSVGRCYGQFEQTTDDEVVALLSESGARAHREESPRPH
jgi:predicted phosphoribosyltransferase